MAFIESFQIAGPRPAITESMLAERSLSRIRIGRPVRLVNLTASGALTRIGADGRIFSGAYASSQLWSAAIRNHPEAPDGILYRPRHDPARLALALFDPVMSEVTAGPAETWLTAPELPGVLETYGIAVL